MDNNDIVPGFDDEARKSDQFSISLDMRDNTLIMHVKGSLDYQCTNELARKINIGIDKYSNVVMNISNVSYMSSTIIGTFVSAFKKIKDKSGDFIFVGMNPRVYEVFQLLGFSSFFKFSENVSEAIKIMADHEEEEPVFPKIAKCPLCSKKLKVIKAGRFRCPQCKSILRVDTLGTMSLG